MTDLILPVLALAAVAAGVWLASRGNRAGWWLAGAAVVLAALSAILRRRPALAPPGPPPGGQTGEAVRRTAGDIIAEHRAEADARIDAAAKAPDREAEIAKLVDARKRRR